jgi:hypothetical protein
MKCVLWKCTIRLVSFCLHLLAVVSKKALRNACKCSARTQTTLVEDSRVIACMLLQSL